MKYVFAVDLDGTLLNNKSNLSNETIEYIKKLDKDKFEFVITTGRPLFSMIKFYKELELNSYTICDSGTSILKPNSKDKQVMHSINKSQFKAIFEKVKHTLETAIFTVGDTTFIYKRIYNDEFNKHVTEGCKIVIGDFNKIDILPPTGGLFIVKESMEKEFLELVKNDDFGVRNWGPAYGSFYYEFYNLKHNKATSLTELLSMLKIDTDHLFCIGDSINDVEMMSLTKNSVAMLNAKDIVKEKAKYITEYDNDENGVIRFIEKIIKAM